MNTGKDLMYEWNTINWKHVQKSVFKLQKRIYQASRRGDKKGVRKLQKLLSKSWSGKLLAVRKVTQDNQGKKTAGVDGVKSLTANQRVKLVKTLSLKNKVKPVRRVWIAKSNSLEKRPLGIPTLSDRALQMLVKLALEPEWEAQFEPNSYGFRHGCSAHDAIAAIFTCINQRAKYVLDADIEKCFDNIHHEKLLEKLGTFSSFHRIIKKWLKAGILEGEIVTSSEKGTPQGGVISPLLANVALHGLENYLQSRCRRRRKSGDPSTQKLTVIRYADDFVLLHEDKTVIEYAKGLLTEWLQALGLSLKTSKTRICHTLKSEGNQKAGFEFLGMEIRQYKVGKTHSGTDPRGNQLGFKTLIKPQKSSQKKHLRIIGDIIRRHKASPQEALIRELNPVIRGWCNYYSTVVAKDTFSLMDYRMYQILRRWALRRHHAKHKAKIFRKYWRIEKGTWRFDTQAGVKLKYHSYTPIKRHVKVQGDRSPFNGDWSYWSKRLRHSPIFNRSKLFLLNYQKGKCNHCRLIFMEEDALDEDHKSPLILKGPDVFSNRQLLHRHCHDLKTCDDGSYLVRGTVN